ncbi:uncharacterized protein HGUI_03672 [Hanseniaspora guilliermondii]|uniref:4-hydroxyphenylpyruvate dioxygenase n=1 Tax=Hanseniaspora guilliermondii TaxID=56406 RepID=A0A1L0D2S2_9ASCO|nr:uncharacterized protein HGUI_03672 [Hanseniaspora guilliermondii]
MTSTTNVFYENFLTLISQSTKLPNIYKQDLANSNINVVSTLDKTECLIDDFHHMIYFTDNVVTTSFYFEKALGFQPIFSSGLNTGNKYFCSKVLKSGSVIIEILCPLQYQALEKENFNISSLEYEQILAIIAKDFMSKHGNGIGVISFQSDWIKTRKIINKIKNNTYLKGVLDVFHFEEKNPWSSFFVKISKTGICQLILSDFEGHFTHKTIYKAINSKKIINTGLSFERVDHTVLNVLEGHLNDISAIMKELYQLVDFWKPKSVIKTKKTGLNTKVLASKKMVKDNNDYKVDKCVKFPINEPLIIDKNHFGQIEEYLLFNNGPGIQHIAISCSNIIDTIDFLESQGYIEFLKISSKELDSYYEKIHDSLLQSRERYEDVNLQKFVTYLLNHFEKIKLLNILVDINTENEILLQIFTKSVSGRPCLFFEFIQRFRNEGFGEGNFNSLFKSLEEDQIKRDTL